MYVIKNIVNSVLSYVSIFWNDTFVAYRGGLRKNKKDIVKGNWCKNQLPFCFCGTCKRAANAVRNCVLTWFPLLFNVFQTV